FCQWASGHCRWPVQRRTPRATVTASRLIFPAALCRGQRDRRSGGCPVFLLGKPPTTTNVSIGNLQAMVERKINRNALKATYAHHAVLPALGWPSAPGLPHHAAQNIAAIGTHANGFPTAPASHVKPQGFSAVLARPPLEEASQPAHTALPHP